MLCKEVNDKLLLHIFFVSKGLTKAEKNYHTTDLETLAVCVEEISLLHLWVEYSHKN